LLDVLKKLQQGLNKTKSGFVDGVNRLVQRAQGLDDDLLEELEDILIAGDLGMDTSAYLIEQLRQASRQHGAYGAAPVKELLKQEMEKLLTLAPRTAPAGKPTVISIVGVNGAGKTTSIGKLAYKLAGENRRVLLAAADTFRAAAIEQLELWSQRAGVDIIHAQHGADPAAVAFDALKAAMSRAMDVLIIDTAGRLHTKANLMAELSKLHKVLERQCSGAPHEVLLVIDATTGQNGLTQARKFAEAVPVTGVILTKLDGTAKGGIVFSIVRDLQIPVKYVGLGERLEDLQEFHPHEFIEALFS
jgi:fused signal recognition particle receptor